MNTSDGNNLIFLISQPRSGSTMLQLILAGHPDIATTSEPWIALPPLLALKEGIDARYDGEMARQALKEFLEQSGVNEVFYKNQVNGFLSSFYKQALNHQRKKYFLDKTPRYYLIIDELVELFPKAKFIILLRHPLAVLNSMIKTWVKDDIKQLGLLKDDLLLAPKILVDAGKKYPFKCLTVRYEDFIARPETLLKELCQYIDIEYSEDMLYYGDRLPEWKLGDQVGIHASPRPSTDSLMLWKEGFNTCQLRLVAHSYLEEIGRDLMEELGYRFDDAVSAIPVLDAHETGSLITWAELMEYNQLKAQRDILLAQREDMLNCLSWRITKPLRSISNLLKKR